MLKITTNRSKVNDVYLTHRTNKNKIRQSRDMFDSIFRWFYDSNSFEAKKKKKKIKKLTQKRMQTKKNKWENWLILVDTWNA